ncbi:MAG: nucleotide exchange factor GrpE [Oscillospiraceae bacterium]|nr:nucleotide exchange factor GrpE [Oscillospiraceae bacterium]
MAKSKSTQDNAKSVTKEETKTAAKSAEKKIKSEESEQEKSNNSVDTAQNSSLQDELRAEKDKYLRLAAEYENFRKRTAKEREMIYSDARINVITKLLPVYDNLERALNMECVDAAYYKGVAMIMTQLTDVFEEMGVKLIPAVGEPFDPNRHNAVMKIEDPNWGDNIIAEEYQKGFILGDRVIRCSTVVVAN